MTEEEAKTKWCPAVRYAVQSVDVNNTQLVGKCIGSQCMAWRWGYRDSDRDMQKSDTDGYCGLAGLP